MIKSLFFDNAIKKVKDFKSWKLMEVTPNSHWDFAYTCSISDNTRFIALHEKSDTNIISSLFLFLETGYNPDEIVVNLSENKSAFNCLLERVSLGQCSVFAVEYILNAQIKANSEEAQENV